MTGLQHRIYLGTMAAIVTATTVYLSYVGYSYYRIPVEDRFYHQDYDWLSPSGVFGHGLGIIGTLLIIIGVTLYIARKNYGFMERQLRLKYLLEFHIFLCTLGPIMIVFHTSFKFGGIVSIAFWSMVAVVASGVVGRYIYIQIPRTIQGKEIGLDKLHRTQQHLRKTLTERGDFTQNESQDLIALAAKPKQQFLMLKRILETRNTDKKAIAMIRKSLKEERVLSRRIRNYERMQQLFKYWHVAHKPFALIMLVFALIHIVVTLMFGYKWIF